MILAFNCNKAVVQEQQHMTDLDSCIATKENAFCRTKQRRVCEVHLNVLVPVPFM